jgi:hypothetical protein
MLSPIVWDLHILMKDNKIAEMWDDNTPGSEYSISEIFHKLNEAIEVINEQQREIEQLKNNER